MGKEEEADTEAEKNGEEEGGKRRERTISQWKREGAGGRQRERTGRTREGGGGGGGVHSPSLTVGVHSFSPFL